MKPFKKDTILLLVANPVDVLTCFAQEIAGLPKSQVIGSGTFLDSIRLRGLLADQAGVRSILNYSKKNSDMPTVSRKLYWCLRPRRARRLAVCKFKNMKDLNHLLISKGCLVDRHRWRSPSISGITSSRYWSKVTGGAMQNEGAAYYWGKGSHIFWYWFHCFVHLLINPIWQA